MKKKLMSENLLERVSARLTGSDSERSLNIVGATDSSLKNLNVRRESPRTDWNALT
jgi:hypothetical protein